MSERAAGGLQRSAYTHTHTHTHPHMTDHKKKNADEIHVQVADNFLKKKKKSVVFEGGGGGSVVYHPASAG